MTKPLAIAAMLFTGVAAFAQPATTRPAIYVPTGAKLVEPKADDAEYAPEGEAMTQSTATHEGDAGSLDYLIALPADYDADAEKRWPLVIFLHGSGERGDDVQRVAAWGPPKLAKAGGGHPGDRRQPAVPRRVIVVAGAGGAGRHARASRGRVPRGCRSRLPHRPEHGRLRQRRLGGGRAGSVRGRRRHLRRRRRRAGQGDGRRADLVPPRHRRRGRAVRQQRRALHRNATGGRRGHKAHALRRRRPLQLGSRLRDPSVWSGCSVTRTRRLRVGSDR